MPDLDDSLAPLITALTVESAALLIWFGLFLLSFNVGQNPDVRAVPSSWERWLARLRRVLPRVAGPRTPATTMRARWWSRFERRVFADARTVDDAQDVAFWFPQVIAWVLLPLAVVVVLVAASMPGEVVRTLWVLPTCVLLLNFTVFVSCLVGRQRIWIQRAPFEWRLYRTVAVQHAIVSRAHHRGEQPAAIEERVLHAARLVERELRHRFTSNIAGASEVVAARQWDMQVAELSRSRAERLLAVGAGEPLAWFETWLNEAARAVLNPRPVDSGNAEGILLPRDDRPKAPLIAMFSIVIGIAAVGILTAPASLSTIARLPWDGAPVIVGLFTCANIGLGWIRKRGAAAP